MTTPTELLSLLRGEHSSLCIDYNDHASEYISAAEAIERGIYRADDWVSEAERAKAIAANSVWRITWHPNGQVGFNVVLASTFQAAAEAALAA